MRRFLVVSVVVLAGLGLADAAPKAEPKKAAKSKTTRSRKAAKRTTRPAARHSGAGRFALPANADDLPAYRYGQLSQDACEAELSARGVEFVRETARGVRAPVRLTAPLHGVTFRTDQDAKTRETSPYEVGDCRLMLALEDFSKILAAHDIVEVRHYSMWRPPSKSWPTDKEAKQHAGGVALDAGRFTDKDGVVLDVDRDFHGAIGAKTCGDGAGPRPVTPAASRLREILCQAVAQHMFNVVLTPNFNRPHHNHFHLEVTSGVKWFLTH